MRPKLTYANVVATLALFVALGGTSVAALNLGKDSVKSKNLAPGAVRSSDIAKDAVNSAKVKNGSLLVNDFKAGQLPAGPTGPKGDKGAKGPQGIPGISGLERAATTSVTDSNSPKLATATCETGKQVLGGGYDISGGKEPDTAPNGLANILADVMEPSSPAGPTGSFTVEAWEEDATADTWNVTVYAICATVAP